MGSYVCMYTCAMLYIIIINVYKNKVLVNKKLSISMKNNCTLAYFNKIENGVHQHAPRYAAYQGEKKSRFFTIFCPQ